MANANENKMKVFKEETVDAVSQKIQIYRDRGELNFPLNYSPENAMKSAWLIIQDLLDKDKKPVLEVCTRDSVINSLLDMVIQGLNPAKKQCYFIAYGNKLQMQRSYFGSIHVAKTVDPNIEDISDGEVVYEGDVFAFKKVRGKTVISNHEQKLENINKANIIAAYCSVFYRDGSENSTIMTFAEIKQAWLQSKNYPIDDAGNVKATSVHGKFTAEMAKKTVINKACKTIINSSDDSSLIVNVYKRTENENAKAEAAAEIADNANKIEITGTLKEPEQLAASADHPDTTPEAEQAALATDGFDE